MPSTTFLGRSPFHEYLGRKNTGFRLCFFAIIKAMLMKVVVVDCQAYSSQYIALVLFGLVMCEDKLSMQPRRQKIIQGLRKLPGVLRVLSVFICGSGAAVISETRMSRNEQCWTEMEEITFFLFFMPLLFLLLQLHF